MRLPFMNVVRSSIATLTLGVLLGACSLNISSGGDHGGMDGEHMSADAMFAQMMIPHHEQAVVMADLAVTRAKDPIIVALATEIKAAQGPEIELMSSWLEEWGVPQMPGGDMMGEHGGHGMAGMLTAEQLDEFAATSGDEFDRLFARYMIEHHEGAIDMAEGVLGSGSDPRVAALAREIIVTQQKEILQMRAFLNEETTSSLVGLSPALTHVHAAVSTGDELLVATHDGLHRVNTATGATSRVGGSRDDYMALGGDPAQGLVASGHPGPGSSAANPLGLVGSADGGTTWTATSLEGEVDFHALTARGSEVIGWDTRGALLWSSDRGRTWSTGPSITPTSLAWFGDSVWIAHPDEGLLKWRPGSFDLERADIPGVLVAASPDGDVLWRLDQDGSVYRSEDAEAWALVGTVNRVEAFVADRDTAYAVSASGVQKVSL